ncbi:MAG: DUF2007 domain-containing protein [Lysobacteraceae bacterium]
MRVVYEAENLFDAHLVRGRLQCEGVAAHVRGEYLTGAMGELPVSGLVAVCVIDEDAPRALALLERWRNEPPLDEDFAEESSPYVGDYADPVQTRV